MTILVIVPTVAQTISCVKQHTHQMLHKLGMVGGGGGKELKSIR